jgi:hypothetical protein
MGKQEMRTEFFFENLSGTRTLGRPRRRKRSKDDSKMNLMIKSMEEERAYLMIEFNDRL